MMADMLKLKISTEGNLRFKIDWSSLIVGSELTVFALFYFVFEGNFPSTSPWEAYIWRGDLMEGFFALPVWGAYIGGVYTWRGLFWEFYGIVTLYIYFSFLLSATKEHLSWKSWVDTVGEYSI